MSAAQVSEAVAYSSNLVFEVTLERLAQLIEATGLTVIARTNQFLNTPDVAMPRTVLLTCGRPRDVAQTAPMMSSAKPDQPLRVLVSTEPDGRVLVSFDPIAPILLREYCEASGFFEPLFV